MNNLQQSTLAISRWERGESETISWQNENGVTEYGPGTVPGGPNIGKPAFQFLIPIMKPISQGGTVIMETENFISFIPAGFRLAPTVNTMNPVREEIGGTTALMSLVHVLTVPKNVRIHNANTLNESHVDMLEEMEELGQKSVEALMSANETMIGSLKWVLEQDSMLQMNDGRSMSTKVTESDISPTCRIFFNQVLTGNPFDYNIEHTYHVGPAASIGWLHLHSYVGQLKTTAYDTMEHEAMSKGYCKNTPSSDVIASISPILERCSSVNKPNVD